MAIPLKYNTASQEVPLGYFLDSTDGNTEETGLTIANTDIKLWKSGATTLANKNSGGATHISNGIYYCVLDATDTNTYGPLVIFVHVSGALAIRVECVVMEADAYDALYAAAGTGHLEADAVQISGDSTAADNLESACDNYSVTRGLSGTALPAAAADAAGGIPISDAGGLDMDNLKTELDGLQGTDGKCLISTDAQDLSGTLDVNTKTITAGIIANATFNADVGSTAYASNIIALAVRKVLDELNLDHLMKVATGAADMTTEIVDNSALSRILANGDTSAFDPSTDGLQPTRDHIGDGSNLTEAGGDGDHLTNIGTIATCTNLTNAPTNGDLTATMKASVNTEVDNAMNTAIASNPTARSANDFLIRAGTAATGNMTINETTGAYSMKKVDVEATEETFGGSKAAAGTVTSGAGVTTRNPS